MKDRLKDEVGKRPGLKHEVGKTHYLIQHLSVAVQQGNATLVLGTSGATASVLPFFVFYILVHFLPSYIFFRLVYFCVVLALFPFLLALFCLNLIIILKNIYIYI